MFKIFGRFYANLKNILEELYDFRKISSSENFEEKNI